ncbi:methionine ABC transporter permease [Shouchella clausii]|uniref:Metal ion ABC transporter permease n=3 Tax=Shouchella TaxID=2893057 RepID=Q5WDP2_SHOC1|nr:MULTISPECIES: methionine ABC transporter permease [Shouchella]ALA54143.1 Methionine ABC transporter permease protein [Shouchella clausii]KKI85346.1 methionine ABC transporter permease [Shouchella clausii]MBU3229309.1 ABC transporter permease [Shouchella clausii]MBU3265469.1 ABC transporter permease [Shouchella clausii]MBU3506209.1 ABC transporter permease [Shouchella clausii]
MIAKWFPNVVWEDVWAATQETVYMTVASAVATFFIGLLLGLFLYLTAKGNPWQNRFFYKIVAAFVNVFRSIPFIILIILLIPFTRALVGSIFGPSAALPALIIGAAPFYARMVEIALREVDKGVVEAAQAMGSTNRHIIFKVLIPESMPALVSGITVTTIALIGYTAMAGTIGAGGLGTLAFQQGFQRTNPDVMVVATVVILAIVFVFQWIGDFFTSRLDKR